MCPQKLLTSVASIALLSVPAAAHVTIDLVSVGDVGNPPDIRYDPAGFGAVNYAFSMGKFEVTNGQYRAFLNAKAALSDSHGLYNQEMISAHGGIQQTGSGTPEDPWVYLPKDNDLALDTHPVNFVSIWDAARFINWLHNGQGDGDTETGAYLNLDDVEKFKRQPGAKFVLPTEHEWYKAAYYDPHKNSGEPGYWEFPTQSDERPSPGPPPGADMIHGSANHSSSALTPVGAYTAKPSTSFYGTYDQGGNLWEWNETQFTDEGVQFFFGLRGGSFDNIYGLEAAHRDNYPAHFENRIMGFRVAFVPEPAGAMVLLGGAVAWMMRRR